MKHKRDPLQQFKTEADEHLFVNLHFDALMKARVMQSLEIKKRASLKDRFRPTRMKWIGGVVTAAVVASMILFTAPLLNPDSKIAQPPENPLTEEAFVEVASPPMTFGTDSTILKENDQTAPLPTEQFQLNSFEDAKSWYGDHLLIASYVPDLFQLDTILAHGKNRGIADAILITYVFGDRPYTISQQKIGSHASIHSEEVVDVHGIDAYVTSIESDSALIQWVADDVHFMVSGAISKEEALRVARSLYE